MPRALLIVFCLVFSGLAALVYQIIWTRLLGFAFGTTTEAISTVLAVFFAGMAAGNWIAARNLWRVRRPLRLYALLELGIGAFALVSLPILQELDGLHAWVGTEHGPGRMTAIRVLASALVLLPPTMAMGATLPVVARALVTSDASLGRWSAILYTGNTFGAVLGAYLCGFWMIPLLGLTRAVLTAACLNLAVAALVLAAVRGRESGLAGMHPEAPGGPPGGSAAIARTAPAGRTAFLVFFGVSGFVAIGYEIVWSRVFGIVMEGTLYGFAAVLACFLLGISLGSLAIAPWVDRIRDLPRAFGLLHVGIAATVALGVLAVPYLPYAHQQLAAWTRGDDALHLLFLLVVPIVLVPTALFGAAFPLLIRIYSGRAQAVGEGMGLATAVNTAGSIAASLLCGFWALPRLGMDATLYALVLVDLGVALLVLVGFQTTRGRERLAATALAGSILLGLSVSFNGVRVESAIAGREIQAGSLAEYTRELERSLDTLSFQVEGRSSIVSLYETPSARMLRTNGLPESLVQHRPPYYSLETVLLGMLPYLMADAPERALVIGLGGGNTVAALARTGIAAIDVVELESEVAQAVRRLHAGRHNPLDDPRVRLRINDGRNELLLGRHRGGAGYAVIASQPSHPWLQGAANLFTEEFFALARENLATGGVFALWLNGFRTDAESVLAVVSSFERVFPGSLLVNGVRNPGRGSLLLLGGPQPLRPDPARMARRLEEPGVAGMLSLFGIHGVAEVLAQLEGPAAAFAAIRPEAANTDDNAFVETRIPRRLGWEDLDFASIERRLAADAPVLPALDGRVDVEGVARALLGVAARPGAPSFAPKVERLLHVHGGSLAPEAVATLRAEARLQDPAREAQALLELRRLADSRPDDSSALRALGRHLARRDRPREAAQAFGQAYGRSGDAEDAYGAGRSLHALDRAGAWHWFQQIQPDQASRFPGLAFFQAERALLEGREVPELRAQLRALKRYRDTEEGRTHPGVDALLARVAAASGDARAARAHADAAHRRRLRRAEPSLDRAERSLEAGDHEACTAALDRAAALLPGDPRVAELRARAALARGDTAALEAALAELRGFAPSLAHAVLAENRFRAAHDLPLLADRSAEALMLPASRR